MNVLNSGNTATATIESIARDLIDLGVEPGQTLLVHSSLSSIGWVSGGPVSVIAALDSALGDSGTLVMPTHSGQLCDPALRRGAPLTPDQIRTIREAQPAFDPLTTPTRGMGVIPERFRSQPRVIRSNHPHDSFAARGPRAMEIVAQHDLNHGLGDTSPLAVLYKLDANILLLGVGHNSSTSLHLAENRAHYRGKRNLQNGAAAQVAHKKQWIAVEHLDYEQSDFNRIGHAYALETRETSYGYIGHGQSMLMPMRGLVDYAVRWMEQNR